jgi:hypothetical protein
MMTEATPAAAPVDTGAAAAAAAAVAGAGTVVLGDPGASAAVADAGAPAADVKPAGEAGLNPWGENWRDALIKANPKGADRLGKFKTPDAMLETILAADSKIGELTAAQKGMLKIPGKDAKPEEVAAFQKALGVPEHIDGYGQDYVLPDNASEADKAADLHFRQTALKHHFTPEQYKAGRQALAEAAAINTKAREQHAVAVAASTEKALKAELGAEYDATLVAANAYIVQRFGSDHAGLLNLQMADGTKLGAYLPFVKFIMTEARAGMDGGPFVSGQGAGGVDVDAEIRTIMAKGRSNASSADQREYALPATQKRLMQLTTMQANAGR